MGKRRKTEIIRTIKMPNDEGYYRLVYKSGEYWLYYKWQEKDRFTREPMSGFWAVTRFIDQCLMGGEWDLQLKSKKLIHLIHTTKNRAVKQRAR